MSGSLVENLEKAGQANVALEELIREAHSTIKALRQAERDVHTAVANAKIEIESMVDKVIVSKMAPHVDNMAETINERLQSLGDHTIKEFSKVVDPLMDSLKIVSEHMHNVGLTHPKGSFFD